MWILSLLGCGYELVAADLTLVVEPVDGSEGAHVDTTIPMRLELYGPELSAGELLVDAFHGFVQTPLDADVACFDAVVLDAGVSRDQLALFFTPDGDVLDDKVMGTNFLMGGFTTRARGRADQVLDFIFPCLPDPIPHEVSLSWEVDRAAPVPYTEVP